jgi:glucose/mannose transport system substrate-binding protein
MTIHSATRLATAIAAVLSINAAQAQDGSVEVLHWWTTGGTAAAAAKLKEAALAAGVNWKDVAVAGNENQRTLLRTKMMKGDAPGAAQIVGDIEQFADQRDKLFDLNAIAKEQNWDAVLPKVIQDYVKVGSGYYAAVPLNVHRLSVMYVNVALLNKLGAKEAPKTWDEFFVLADKAKAAGINPIAWGNPMVMQVVFNQVAFGTMGAPAFKKAFIDGDEATLRSPALLKTFENYRRLGAYADKSAITKRWNEGTQSVMAGETLAQIMGDWAKGEFTRAGKKSGVDYLCVPSPGTAGSMNFNTDGFLFLKTRVDQSKAQATLARVLMDKSTQESFNLAKGSVPARMDVDLSKFDDCSKTTYAEFNAANKAGTLVPLVDMLIPAGRANAIRDVYIEFHSKPEMTAQQAVDKVLAATKAN